MSANSIRDMSDQLGPVKRLTPDEIAAATRCIDRHARDEDDRAALVAMVLGGSDAA